MYSEWQIVVNEKEKQKISRLAVKDGILMTSKAFYHLNHF